ncbi:hypothetical protein [Ferrimonas lipolytica]|uniref:Uncharacterized protein n=1 Tax=Ferrimonas lipolytica TaxID=2724191 RepID=A0A6H1UCT7_9GAMM|nr:hypothetical protein [Ferrimonas lipolytica]QIZ76400.1 hypothetical protein HER31_05720 [Ferrimonas lipolytica]
MMSIQPIMPAPITIQPQPTPLPEPIVDDPKSLSDNQKTAVVAKAQVNHYQGMIESYQNGSDSDNAESSDDSNSVSMQQAVELNRQIQRAETLENHSQNFIESRYSEQTPTAPIAINIAV